MFKKKRLVLLGSTGNVGTQVLEVVDQYPEKFSIVGLAAGNNVELLKKQIKKYRPQFVSINNPEKVKALKDFRHLKILSGEKALEELAKLKNYDILVNSVVGLAGIRTTLTAIRNKKTIALANKETLVAAGEIIMKEAKKYSVFISPIDSEHSALLQCLNGEKIKNVKRLILTCSGGALHDKTLEQLKNISIADALGHKTWAMGQKITIDSATLMNKGFEVIEAMHLYGLPAEKISVVIHPQSIIHSMVEYTDTSIIAQLSVPDMRLPIQYALSFPDRWDAPIKRWDFSQTLTFDKPDLKRFPCLAYALKAAKIGGTLPAVMNASNDFMVAKFLAGECSYLDIHRTIKKVMDTHQNTKKITLEKIEKAIKEATLKTEELWKKLKK